MHQVEMYPSPYFFGVSRVSAFRSNYSFFLLDFALLSFHLGANWCPGISADTFDIYADTNADVCRYRVSSY